MDDLVLGEYAIHTAREGFSNILHRASGEIMHGRLHPMQEAQSLYVDQSELAGILVHTPESSKKIPVTLWDVGLGAAANAMAAITCHECLSSSHFDAIRPMQIISFENDLDSLRLAASHRDHFDYLRHPAVDAMLESGRWQSHTHPLLTWTLVHGDFPDTITGDLPAPDVIFYDLFSGKTHSRAWELETFCRIHQACGDHCTELFTYTVSTAARAALLVAGFYVARGRGIGPKSDTTIALTESAARSTTRAGTRRFLDSDWMAKWQRSTAKFPVDVAMDAQEPFMQRLKSHPQFGPG